MSKIKPGTIQKKKGSGGVAPGPAQGSLKKSPAQIEAERLAMKAQYIKRKEKVFEREKTNDRMVIVFRSDNKWWAIIEKSAIYYAKIIYPEIKTPKQRKNPIVPDQDYSLQSSTGIVRVPDIGNLIKLVEEAGFKIKKESNENFVSIELRNKVTAEQYNIFLNQEKGKRMLAEQMVSTAVQWPGIKTATLEQLVLCRSMAKTLDQHMQRVLGDPMMEDFIKIITTVELAARGTFDRAEAIILISECIDRIDGYVLCALHMQLFNSEQIYNLSDGMMKLRRLVESEIKKNGKQKV